MAAGFGSGRSGYGLPRAREAQISQDTTVDNDELVNNKEDGEAGLTTFAFSNDRQGDVLEGEILFTTSGSRGRMTGSAQQKARVISSLNGMGKIARASFPNDEEMQREVVMSGINPVGIADADVPLAPEKNGTKNSALTARVAGAQSLPAFRDFALGDIVVVVPRYPKGTDARDYGDTNMMPAKMQAGKVILRLEKADDGGESFARVLEMNMKHYLRSRHDFERGFDMRLPQTLARINALQTMMHQVLMNFFTTAHALGIGQFSVHLPIDGEQRRDIGLEDLASVLGVVTIARRRQPPRFVDALRSEVLKSAYLQPEDIFSPRAFGFNPATARQTVVSTETDLIDDRSALGQLLSHQLNAQKKYHAAMAEFLRFREQHTYGRVIGDTLAGGLVDVIRT